MAFKEIELMVCLSIQTKNGPSEICGRQPSIEVHDRIFTTTKSLYKRDGFPFYINHMADLDSSIPSKIFYALITSEIVRIARTTTDLINMITCQSCVDPIVKRNGKIVWKHVPSLEISMLC